jgi:hypothetical protein
MRRSVMGRKSSSSSVEVAEAPAAAAEVALVGTAGGASFKDFPTMVSYFRERIENVSKITLEVCWEMGYEVNLIKEAAVYGEKTIENFAEQLSLPNMSVKTLYRYGQFAQSYTRAELKAALAKPHVGWGAINKLLSVHDKEDRTEFEDRLAAEELRPSDLDEEISKYQQEQRGEAASPGEAPSEKSRNFTKNPKKCLVALGILQEMLPLTIKDIEDLDEIAGDDKKYAKVLEVIYSLRETLEEVVPLAKRAHDMAAKVA